MSTTKIVLELTDTRFDDMHATPWEILGLLLDMIRFGTYVVSGDEFAKLIRVAVERDGQRYERVTRYDA